LKHRRMTLAPSILNADFLDLKGALRIIERGGADWVHLDVMDGHFVPNISLGAHAVSCVRRGTRLPLNVHLMVTDPRRHLGAFLKAGADIVTIHVESRGNTRNLLRAIRARGARVGITLKPETPLSAVGPFLGLVDLVLVMTVEPGFGGQAFHRECLPRVAALRRLAPRLDIQVDGGVTTATVAKAVAAGASNIVAGCAVFGARDPVRALRRIRRSGEAAMARAPWMPGRG